MSRRTSGEQKKGPDSRSGPLEFEKYGADADGTPLRILTREEWYNMHKPDRARMHQEFESIVLPKIVQRRERVQEALKKSTKIDFTNVADVQMGAAQNIEKGPWVFLFLADSLDAAKMAMQRTPEARICVLNIADWQHPGGKFLEGSTSQEESLCVRTTLLSHLQQEQIKYPVRKSELVYSPDVLVFSSNLGLLSQEFYVDIISCPALQEPKLQQTMRDGISKRSSGTNLTTKSRFRRITNILRVAAEHRCSTVILAPFGCGAYPVDQVAGLTRTILMDTDWRSTGIKRVILAIDDRKTGRPIWNTFIDAFEEAPDVFIDYTGSRMLTLWAGGSVVT